MRYIDIVFLLFLVFESLDPTGYHSRLKDLLFIILVGYGLIYCLKTRPYLAPINRITILSFVLLPFWGIFIAYITGNLADAPYAMSQVKAMFYIFMFFFLISMRTGVFLKMIWMNGIILSVVTLVLFGLVMMSEVFMKVMLVYSEESKNLAMAYNRNFLGFLVSGVCLRGAPFIIFAFVYNLYQYRGVLRTFFSVILFLSLMVAGSRTPMLVQLFILLVYLYDKNVLGKFFTRIVTLIALGMFVGLVYMLATQENESSNTLKYENFESYVDDIMDGGHAIWGAGVGSQFQAKGRDKKLSYSELSYMDILRMYGVIVGCYMIFLFFAPYFWLRKFFPQSLFLRRYVLGYVLFLILSGTNPLLLGAFGLTGLSFFMVLVNKTSMLSDEERGRDELVIDDYLLR